jgi:hypothetical protein
VARDPALIFVLAGVLLSPSCQWNRVYHGKTVCQLMNEREIAAIFGVPFDAGIYSGTLNFDEDYIGSTCSFDSMDKWKPRQPKLRVSITVEYAAPKETSLETKRAGWERESYNNAPFYTGIHEISGVADVALGAVDYNKAYIVWSILKPSTKVEVSVAGVRADQAEGLAVAVAQKTIAMVKAENAPPPSPRTP